MNLQDEGSGWYAPAVMPPAGHSALGMAAGLTFGASSDGRHTYRFCNLVQLELEAAQKPTGNGMGGVSKKAFEEVLRVFCSRMEPGGPGHTWAERMLEVMPQYYRISLIRWVRQVADNPKRFAIRLQNIALALDEHDLAAEDAPGASLLELLRQSEAQFLQENHWLLEERDARAPAVPGPMPAFMLQFYMRQHSGAGARVARRAGGGQQGSSRAAAGEGTSAAGLADDADSDAADELTHLLPLEQVDQRLVAYDQITKRPGKPPFAPPPRNPPGWPTREQLAELQDEYPTDWQHRLPARMPGMPELPSFCEDDIDTARALEAHMDGLMAAVGTRADMCPKPADLILAGFKGKFLQLKPDEHDMLENPQPEGSEDPEMLCARLLALVDIKGGEKEWPKSLLNEKYMDALNHYEGNLIANAVSDYLIAQRIKPIHADVRELAKTAKAAYDEFVRKNRRPPRLKQPKPRAAEGGQRGRDHQNAERQHGGGRQYGGGGGSGGHWRDQGGGHNRGAGRQEYRRAYMAEGQEQGYSAHAAQQMEVPAATYNAVPPPRHYAQYGGGSRQGGYGSRLHREPCITCGSFHGDVCYVEQPGKAPSYWPGPRAKLVYEAYVLNCKAKGRLQPVRFMGQLQGKGFSKEVADYLAQVGDRQPSGAPGWGAGHGGVQHQAGAASSSGSRGRAAGVGFMAETAEQGYPDLAETFRKGTHLHAEEEQDDADTAYYGCYAESETSEVGEALVSTRRSSGKLTAAAQAAAGSSQQRDAPAAAEQAADNSTSGHAQPAAAGAQQGRPPLPPPVAAQRPAGQGVGQAVTNTTVAPAPAARPKPPLPFTAIQPADGTPPSMFPAPVPRHKGSTVQQAVARGGVMQQLPVSISVFDLANNASVPADAFKRLLSSGATEFTVVQRSGVQGQLGASHLMVNFSSMAEALRLLAPTQAFAALDLGGDQVEVHTSTLGATAPTEEPSMAQEAAGVAAVGEMARADDAAKVGEGAAAGTACAAAGHKAAARLQEPVVPNTVVKRPTTFELLAQTPSTPGITVALLDSETGQVARVLTGLIRRFILDSGADVVLMSEECAKRNRLQLVPSNRRICTSSGQVTRTLSMVNQPVQYVLGKGTPGECAVVEETYVMPGSGSTYDILLGTPLIVKWGLFVDPLASQASYRPFWHSKGDSLTMAHVPVLTYAHVPAAGHGAAKASELTRAQPKLDAELAQPEPPAECESTTGQAPAELQQQLAQGAADEQLPPGKADAAAETLQASQPLQAAQTSVQSSYQPPTSFMIVAA